MQMDVDSEAAITAMKAMEYMIIQAKPFDSGILLNEKIITVVKATCGGP
ncbi:hypothetical protein SAMN04488100_11526 [Alkalibacterium putridalgicola]|uniref:Uncharacterized protein n=1 Tax=Alkalibacterium putridalgicola TaxID=426703 RepID=A0A1H7U1H3_9LACT|nr:hypothetical protein [Alkalibacterium putridalgicola]GEK89504.1 hypothetical protein APU01nite_15430 [Alkalibacterium putridalgicola]SEL90831.1 hypothetical protein SAMN04488100_11526 [Alkalibacterium putridalgicola]